MDFGVFFLLGSPDMAPARFVYERALKQIRLADELGFDSVWIAEHHFSNYGYVPNPLMFAIKAAQVTSRVRIGTAVLVLPFWHPLRVAEEIAMADQLTDGRLEVGVARGYQPYEFARFGVPWEEARGRSDETLEVLLRALSGDDVTHNGAHYTIPAATIFPRPLQQPYPPVWLAAQSQESFATAARLGLRSFTAVSGRPIEVLRENWSNCEEARRGYPDAPRDFAVQQHLSVAPTDDEARAQMEHFLYSRRQVGHLSNRTEQIERGLSADVPLPGEPTLDELFETHTLSGSPATVRRKLERYLDVAEITQLNCTFQMGAIADDVAERSMELFAREVMPHFRQR